ncbi:unnamed protein product [Boreogadus saida]
MPTVSGENESILSYQDHTISTRTGPTWDQEWPNAAGCVAGQSAERRAAGLSPQDAEARLEVTGQCS